MTPTLLHIATAMPSNLHTARPRGADEPGQTGTMDYSPALWEIIQKTETFRAILEANVRSLDIGCSSRGGTAQDRLEVVCTRPNKRKIHEV